MINIDDIKKIVINLKRRPDRLENFDREMNYIGWDYDIFEAVENIVDVDGCALSHVKVVENFLKTDDEHIMILEDDCFFMPYAKNQLEKSLKELNNLEWDFFNLGPSLHRPINNYSDNLLDLTNLPPKDNHHSGIYGLACYIINRKFGEEFVKFKIESQKPIDVYLDEDVFHNFKCFAPSMPVITQRNGFSDNVKKTDYYHYFILHKWNLYCENKINTSYYDIGFCEREKDYLKKITINKNMVDENIINLDLWGGEHILDKETLNYEINRTCGLFSNMTVGMYGIMKYHSLGYLPKTISLYLSEYKYNYNFYNDLFKPNDINLNFDDIDENEMFNFFRYCEPNSLGLGRRKNDVNFTILNRLLSKYFTLSDTCNQMIDDIIIKHNISLNNTVFIWARKTDKVFEVDIPTPETYINILKENNLINKDIILQTDDISVLDEFKSLGLNFRTLDELPYSYTSNGFHVRMSTSYDDEQFYNEYSMSKVEYLQKLLSISKIASMCQYSIVYPGCLSTLIPIFKNNFNNQFSFKNNTSLIE